MKYQSEHKLENVEIMTDMGYKPILRVLETKPMPIWSVDTTTHHLEAADKHIVMTEDGDAFMDELKPGMRLLTDSGPEPVVAASNLHREESCVDFIIGDDSHVYYADGVLSHNTTTSMAFLLHQAITRSHIRIAILANKLSTATEILDRLKFAYENLPWFLQVGIETWNKQTVKFGNGTEIIAAATSSSSIRGKSINCLMLDELAHVENDTEFMASTYPVISSFKNSRVIITSTPKGLNLFHQLFKGAKEGHNAFKPSEYDWRVVPGRDEAWKEETIANTSPMQFAQEYECAFFGSSDTLLSGDCLQSLSYIHPLHETEHMRVYAMPDPTKTYCIAVDTALGTGGDYSVASVFDVSAMPYKLVAVFRHNLMQPIEFAAQCFELHKQYNDAFMIVENNSYGKIVADSLWYDYECDNMFCGKEQWEAGCIGMTTTKKTKSIGCSHLKALIESKQLEIRDAVAILELSTFSKTRSGSYAAENGKHDDICMTLVLFAYVASLDYFANINDINFRHDLREAMESNTSFMFIDDGTEDLE